MKDHLLALTFTTLAIGGCATPSNSGKHLVPKTTSLEIAAVLDSFHDAAATADETRYFGHFAADGVFLGTDATEYWPVADFRAFAQPYFGGESAWVYVPQERHIYLAPGGAVAWFYEKLLSDSYGETRGSGILVWERGGWRISQYVLSFPVPNHVAGAVVELIKGSASE